MRKEGHPIIPASEAIGRVESWGLSGAAFGLFDASIYLGLGMSKGTFVQNVRKRKGGRSFRKCFTKFDCVIQSHSPGNGLRNRTRIGVSRDSVVALWVAWGEGWS